MSECSYCHSGYGCAYCDAKAAAQEVERLRSMYGKAFMVARELLEPDAYEMFVKELDEFRAKLDPSKY